MKSWARAGGDNCAFRGHQTPRRRCVGRQHGIQLATRKLRTKSFRGTAGTPANNRSRASESACCSLRCEAACARAWSCASDVTPHCDSYCAFDAKMCMRRFRALKRSPAVRLGQVNLLHKRHPNGQALSPHLKGAQSLFYRLARTMTTPKRRLASPMLALPQTERFEHTQEARRLYASAFKLGCKRSVQDLRVPYFKTAVMKPARGRARRIAGFSKSADVLQEVEHSPNEKAFLQSHCMTHHLCGQS